MNLNMMRLLELEQASTSQCKRDESGRGVRKPIIPLIFNAQPVGLFLFFLSLKCQILSIYSLFGHPRCSVWIPNFDLMRINQRKQKHQQQQQHNIWLNNIPFKWNYDLKSAQFLMFDFFSHCFLLLIPNSFHKCTHMSEIMILRMGFPTFNVKIIPIKYGIPR